MNAGQREDHDPIERDPQNVGGTGGLSVGDYQRLRKGYERALSPEALDRMGGDAPVGEVRTSRRVVRIRPETYIPATVDEEWQGDYRSDRGRSGGRIGPIGVFLILATGLLGGLVLYAGGADYLSGLFGEEEVAESEDLTLVTERPGADLTSHDAGLTPGEMMTAEELTAEEDGVEDIIPEENLAAAEQEAAAQRKREESERRAAEERRSAEERQIREEAAEGASTAARNNEPAAALQTGGIESTGEREDGNAGNTPSTRTNSGTVAGRFTAQVGATPDRAEADRIASRLRARGGTGVTVIAAEKEGSPIYRVRFGSFSSEEEARQTSNRLGFSDVWIVRR